MMEIVGSIPFIKMSVMSHEPKGRVTVGGAERARSQGGVVTTAAVDDDSSSRVSSDNADTVVEKKKYGLDPPKFGILILETLPV